MEGSLLVAWLTTNLSALPTYIACLVGIILACNRWRYNPQHSLVVVIALSLAIVLRLVAASITFLIPTFARDGALSITAIYNVWGIIAMLFDIIIWICLLFAIFGWRSNAPRRELQADPSLYVNPGYQERSREK